MSALMHPWCVGDAGAMGAARAIASSSASARGMLSMHARLLVSVVSARRAPHVSLGAFVNSCTVHLSVCTHGMRVLLA